MEKNNFFADVRQYCAHFKKLIHFIDVNEFQDIGKIYSNMTFFLKIITPLSTRSVYPALHINYFC